MKQSTVHIIGWLAASLAIAMFVSYIDQIRLNLSGQPGSIILPIVTTINCFAWVLYGLLKSQKDWPIIVCNFPGIILGIITTLTAIL